MFLSSFYKTEMVEFRVNEKRNIPPALRDKYNPIIFPCFKFIHYFLVRGTSVEIIRQHSAFRKMRRLEPSLWEHYLEELGSPRPESMIIYHWRSPAQETGAKATDFIALTIFRRAKANPLLYMAAILLLGAGGSATQAFLTNFAQDRLYIHNTWGTQLAIVGLLVCIVLAIWFILIAREIFAKISRSMGNLRRRLMLFFTSRAASDSHR